MNISFRIATKDGEEDYPVLIAGVFALAAKHQIQFVMLTFNPDDDAPDGYIKPRDVMLFSNMTRAISNMERDISRSAHPAVYELTTDGTRYEQI
jgi:hypothetical protein